jgi:hypothetical protein
VVVTDQEWIDAFMAKCGCYKDVKGNWIGQEITIKPPNQQGNKPDEKS